MSAILGSGDFKYEHLLDWHKLPRDAKLMETPGVAVDSNDQVYAFSRNPQHPVMVFDRDGNFLRGFGEGIFGDRTHGILIGPDGSVWCVDDGIHTITKFSAEGQLLMTIGTSGQSSEIWQGEPFNRPTHAAISKQTGHVYITDGYGIFVSTSTRATASTSSRGASPESTPASSCGPIILRWTTTTG